MSAIYYIGHYDLKDEPRSVSPAAVTMMDYVSEVIQREGFQCNIPVSYTHLTLPTKLEV